MSSIDIRNLSFCYRSTAGSTMALQDLSLSIPQGQFVCLVGHSGCGKSTLLSMLAGLEKPDKGSILVDGRELGGPGTDRAMVFQHYSLFPWMTVGRNVAFSIEHSRPGLGKDEVAALVRQHLEQVGMAAQIDSYPHELSGGMQQRVAIARALAMDAPVLLLDEPFGALDARNRAELQQLLVRLWQESQPHKTVVFVTHDLHEAILLADRIVFMRPRRIERVIDVPFERPRDIDRLAASPAYHQLRDELLGLFYLDEDEEPAPAGALAGERGGLHG